MPPVSEKQRRAMAAAKAGKSTLGIPKDVGSDFISSDPGGKLPASAPSSKGTPEGLRAKMDRQRKTKGKGAP